MNAEAVARIDAAVASAEARTDAEILVAVVSQSGRYADADHARAAFTAVVALAVLLAAHYYELTHIPDALIVPLVAVAYVVEYFASRAFPSRRRLSTSRARRVRQVKRAARALFVEERLHATETRKGLLVYVSQLEQMVEIVADLGIEGRVDNATWNAVARELSMAATAHELEPALVEALDAAGELLAQRVPRGEGTRDEIARRVLVRA